MDRFDASMGVWKGERALFSTQHRIPSPLYIFGYGSLCWKPDFKYKSSFVATLTGWRRVFTQLSYDHRGTPDRPGLVATLISDEELAQTTSLPRTVSCVTGVCFRIDDADADLVLDALDFREKGGYQRTVIKVALEGSEDQVDALLYTATLENPLFRAEYLTDLDAASAVIARSEGPSGLNSDYLFELDSFLCGVGCRDSDLEHLVRLTRERLGN